MCDGIMLSIDEDGVASMYDDTYDITIHCESKEEQEEAIKALKSGPKWIPCSERLPEYGVSVLTYDGNCFCVEKRIPIIRDETGEAISSDWWVSDDYDEEETGYYPNLRDGAAIAWMPLPELYKEVKE